MTRQLAVASLRCDHAGCTLPTGGRCAREAEFTDPLTECDELKPEPPLDQHGKAVSAPPPPLVEGEADPAPWRGRHLTLAEAEEMVRRSPARLITILGAHDAGKTSLMASFFLQIANGQYGGFPYRFASSRTLFGFQDLVARANRWQGRPGEQIVGHTPKEDNPAAGRFLHLGVRPSNRADDRHIDLLLSDIPGEWVEEWAQRVDEDARRRLSFVARSSGFVVVVDAHKLLDRNGPRVDARTSNLIRRIASDAGTPGEASALALVFAKIDSVLDRFSPPERALREQRDAWGSIGRAARATWAALEHARGKGFAVAPFAVSAFPKPLAEGQPLGVMAPFSHVMATADRRERGARLVVPVPDGAGYFQAMRRADVVAS